ncbi:helix-turn-helix transcriptional regulator [Leptospira sp. GIMC2001]|uniref:helix-turn-helix transcriptional regulator n=1 Tax=Leptospira sp. GIMC2001 TaxID=1513297 RepID=UPI00234968F8|nr:winged helix-turn-helix domain-containing protein [Leptospira sp. GIMC2001]WCL50613.1 winged helix-turn-helix domain-containing protein [Leptospira sp. GIMC2001]
MDKAKKKKSEQISEHSWTFLSNHSHVLICLHRDPEMRLRDVALYVGITERAVMSIVKDLVESGILEKEKEGRRNQYKINLDRPLRHTLESHHSIKELLKLGK